MTAQPSLNEILGIDAVPDLVGNPNMDFTDFLNLDFEAGSGSDSVSRVLFLCLHQSPQTISPNHTPSPGNIGFVPSPMHYDEDAFQFVFPDEKQQLGAPAPPQINVKEEPVEAAPVTAPAAPAPAPTLELPPAQQAALQQLLTNFMSYQQQFGLVENSSNSINPSLVFDNTPQSVTPSTASVSTAPPPSVDEPLVSISPGETPEINRSTRAGSTFSTVSMEGIDDKIDKLLPLSSIFSTGRGKGGKKGGGMSSVVRGEGEELDDDDSWRPSPEEYKKLSSKEKRQLRNKLSARAFRTRRKDYIGTLEAHIKDRDSVIDAIRAELQSSRDENQDLRRELEALKSSTMSVLHPESAAQLGQSPAMLSAIAKAELTVPPVRRPALNPIINTRKDISGYDARGFWGGGNENFNGSTICHTVFSPELTLPPQPNLNPLLNIQKADKAEKAPGPRDIDSSTFADWAADTPYSLRTMDNYRMQLWSRLTREAAAEKAGVPRDVRPKFLVTPEATSTAATAATSSFEHITTKLTSAFWAAFAGPSSKIDNDKLAAVVTGRARLAVIDDKRTTHSSTTADDLAHAMAGLKVATGTSTLESLRVRENPLGAISGFFKHNSTPLPARA